jgi:hypothetical protein
MAVSTTPLITSRAPIQTSTMIASSVVGIVSCWRAIQEITRRRCWLASHLVLPRYDVPMGGKDSGFFSSETLAWAS